MKLLSEYQKQIDQDSDIVDVRLFLGESNDFNIAYYEDLCALLDCALNSNGEDVTWEDL